MESSSFFIIDLGVAPLAAPLISVPLEQEMRKVLADGKKVLLYLNKRGFANACVCQDCKRAILCPKCDISVKVHEKPRKKLLCHQCGWEENFPEKCPHCRGILSSVGTRIQHVEQGVEKLFSGYRVGRMDSDNKRAKKSDVFDPENYDIILGTQALTGYDIDGLGLAVFLDLSEEAVSENWRALENVYIQAGINIRRGVPVVIQASSPAHPIITLVTEGNYRSFFKQALEQRKMFGYPPYRDIAELIVRSEKQEKCESVASSIATHLTENRPEEGDLHLHPLERKGGEYELHITVRAQNVYEWLLRCEKEIHRTREIHVVWK